MLLLLVLLLLSLLLLVVLLSLAPLATWLTFSGLLLLSAGLGGAFKGIVFALVSGAGRGNGGSDGCVDGLSLNIGWYQLHCRVVWLAGLLGFGVW